jgi:hypothetical protein
MNIDYLISMLRTNNPDGSRRIYQYQVKENSQTKSAAEIDFSDSREEPVKRDESVERENPGIVDGSSHIWKM